MAASFHFQDDNANASDAAPSVAVTGSDIANVEEEDDDNSADASNDVSFCDFVSLTLKEISPTD